MGKYFNASKYVLTSFILVLLIYQVNLFTYSNINGNKEFSPDLNPQPITLQNSFDDNLNISSQYDMYEFANLSSIKNNISTIDISLPTENWNVTDIKLDFTNISLFEERITIEDGPFDGVEDLVDQNTERLGMQLNITEFTRIYAVEIFGFKIELSSDPGTILMEITGWDSGNNRPDMNVIGSPVELNMTNGIAQWYIQKFPEPIELYPGYYALVMEGYSRIKSGDSYYWFINNSVLSSNLYMSYYDRFMGWRWNQRQGDVFLHRMKCWVNKTFFPSEINMTVVIDDLSYLVSDGILEGTGSVNVENISYTLPSSELLIDINTNRTIILNFNLNYTLHLVDKIKINSNVILKEEHDNKWEIRPDIARISSDFSVKFDFPLNWYNISIFKDGLNASSDPNIIKELNSIKILNDTITPNSNWLIKANNIPFNFSISATKNVFKPAEDFEIEAIAPFLQGIYFFRVLDSSGEEVYNESRLVNSEVEIFSFIIRPDAKSGDWKASIFWYNETDAGVAFFIFKIKRSPIFDPFPLILILSIIGASMVSSYSVYKIVKRTRNIRRLKTKRIYDKCVDVLNMDYIILSHKISSLALFDQKFTQKQIDSSLISGFLDAIRSFGIELTESKDQSQTIKLEYKDSTIIMTEYKNLRLIIKMREIPSSSFFEEVRKLSYEIDEKFGRFIEDFKGDVRPFKYVEGLLKKYLFTTFLYPLRIVQRPKVKITNAERNIINKASQMTKKYGLDYFFTSYLFEERVCDPKEYGVIYSLIEKKIFEPVS